MGLEKFREGIISASRSINCDYPEFGRIRDEANRLLKDIDNEVLRLRS